jgi:diaminopimelate epimerase
MPKIPFWKYEGAGNDFVALDVRDGSPEVTADLVREVCHRQFGVGSDGVLVLDRSPDPAAHFRMIYYNADGSRGEMCGNGARCIAAFAVHRGAAPKDMRFVTDAGVHRARLTEDGVAIEFPAMVDPPELRQPKVDGHSWDGDYMVVGNPHFVPWVDDVESVDVENVGRALRYHEAFAPRGVNINFAQPIGDDLIRVRTYERGVEAETLACGTGSVASAWSHAVRSGMQGAVRLRVLTTSGRELVITFRLEGATAQDVEMAGPARLVHEGIWLRP